MRKKYVSMLFVSAAMLSAGALADTRPYVGVSGQAFSIGTSGVKASNGTQTASAKDDTNDTGLTVGANLGMIINDQSRVEVSHYSGEEGDSGFLTATVSSISYVYSTNSAGIHQGWFVGAGISNINIEAEKNEVTESGEGDDTGLLLRAGYEHLFPNGLLLETGLNYNTAKVDLKLNGTGQFSGVETESAMKVLSLNVSLNYIF
jgi:hypothetical protein